MTKYLRTNAASLYLDELLLMGKTTDSAGNVFWIKAQSPDATWGNPSPIDVAVQRWMTDGAVASTQGYENREPYFKVIVSADTSVALAAGEAALVAAAANPSALAWVSPEGPVAAPTTVFELWTVHLEHEFDLDKENRLSRTYGMRCTAKPWTRSESLTSVAAIPTAGAGTTVSVDTCASTTGWTGSPNAATTTGVAVKETVALTVGGGVVGAYLTRAGSVTGFGTTPYLQLDMSATGGGVVAVSFGVKIDGLSCTKVAQVGNVSWWSLPAGHTSFTSLQISAGGKINKTGGNFILTVADVSRTDTVAPVTSHRQISRSMAVGGAVKTSGSIQIASPSATPLGTCLVYTCPDTGSGYTPPLRQFRTSGNTVTLDSTCASGNHEGFVTGGVSTGTITYTIPAGLLPEATYAVVGRFIFGSAALMTVSLSAKVNGFNFGPGMVGTVGTLAASNVWGVLGTISLPAQGLPVESALANVITVSATATTGTHTLDELYLIDITHGAMSLVLAGNTSHTKLWLDAPDADPVRNRPAIYIGTQADRSDAGTPNNGQIISMGDHDLDPDGVLVNTVTDGVDDAVVTASFYQRWYTHAAA